MKKIAVLLALALALSCCLLMLAACGDGDESSDTTTSAGTTTTSGDGSSAASDESSASEPAGESTEPEQSDATSEPDASEPDETTEPDASEPEKNPDASTNEDGSNLALGKPYENSMLHRQGGADVNWAWDDNAPITYPDDGGEMTDGVFPPEDASYDDPAFMGFAAGSPDYSTNGGYAYITVDLGESYELSRLVAYVGTKKLGAGLAVPATVEFLVSEDGTTFTSVGKVVPTDTEADPYVAVEVECDVTGQYLQVRMTGSGWMHICEIEAY